MCMSRLALCLSRRLVERIRPAMEPGNKSPKSSAPPKRQVPSWRNVRIIVLVLVALVVLGGLVGFAILTHQQQGGPVVHETSISQVLSLADQHKLRTATIANNTVTVIASNGERLSASKEDGQVLTQYLRERGVEVSVVVPDSAAPVWLSAVAEGALFALIIVVAIFIMRRSSGAGGGTSQAVPFG